MSDLNLYKVNRLEEVGYNEYDSFIVACETSLEASLCRPDYGWDTEGKYLCDCWSGEIQVELIGTAHPSMEKGVVLASFNAG